MDHFRDDLILIEILTTLTTPTLELPDKIASLNQPHTNQWIKTLVRVEKLSRM